MKSSRRGAARQPSQEAGHPEGHRVPPGEVEVIWPAAGPLTLRGEPRHIRAAAAWFPDLTAAHLTRAALTGHAALPGRGMDGVRRPGLHRRAPSAALCAGLERLTLRWPAPPAPPIRAEPAPLPAAVPPELLGWLSLGLPGAVRAAATWLAGDGAPARVRLTDGQGLHTAGVAWAGGGAGAPLLVMDGDQPCGSIERPGPPDPAREGAAALVLGVVSRQARERGEGEHRTRCARLAAELQGHLLTLGTGGGLPDAPLHTAMRLLGATGAALVTLNPSGEVECPAVSGTLGALGVDLPLPAARLRRLVTLGAPEPSLWPRPELAGEGALLVLPLAPAAGRRGAWVFVCPPGPSRPTPEGWAVLLAATGHAALLQSLGPVPEPVDPGAGGWGQGRRTAAGLLRSLGESEVPPVLAERGLSHLVGGSGAEAGAYLTLRAAPGTPPGAGEVSALVQVGGKGEAPPPAVPPELVRRVVRQGEPLALKAPDPRLPAPLTSALLTPVVVAGRPAGVLALLDRRPGARPAPETPGLLALLAGRVGGASERQTTLHTLARTREGVFRVLGKVLEYRSYETKGHTDRVTGLALRLGIRLDLDYGQLAHLRWGAYLHDLGKIAIPDAVLLKRGPLTATERELMRGHASIGEFILREQGFVPQGVLEVVRHHHERWDGLGYPDGLAGTDIPFLARLFTVADVYDALTSERPYKESWSHEDALAELRRMAGTHLDPELLAAFLTLPPPPRPPGDHLA